LKITMVLNQEEIYLRILHQSEEKDNLFFWKLFFNFVLLN